MDMNKYVLYTKSNRTEYENYDETKTAYDKCSDNLKFLYQPDKTYFIGTLSSTGYIIGHDHAYHKDTAKCCGLFMADNRNQIKTFLEKVSWHHQGSSRRSSKARLYGNGPYGSLYNSNKDWEHFDYTVQHDYLIDGNINLFYMIDYSFGAIDVKSYNGSNPYRLY